MIIGLMAAIGMTAGCRDDADVAAHNLTKAADNFELMRRIVFYNTWTGDFVTVVEGKCSVEYGQARTAYICKIGDDEFIRNFVGKSGQITTIVEQMESVPVNVYHFRRTFKPQTIIPDIDFRGDAGAVLDAITPDNND